MQQNVQNAGATGLEDNVLLIGCERETHLDSFVIFNVALADKFAVHLFLHTA